MSATKTVFLKSGLAVLAWLAVSCSGAIQDEALDNAPIVEDAIATVKFAGRIELPPAEAVPALNKTRFLGGKPEKTETKGHLYTLKGKDLGEFETDEDGAFETQVPLGEWLGDKMASESFDEGVIVVAENGIQKFQNVHHDGASTDAEAVDLGSADVITTLATAAIAQQLDGFSGWGENYAEDSQAGGDIECLYDMQQSFWLAADPSADTIQQEFGQLKQGVVALIAEGKTPDDLGYANWHALFDEVLSGDQNIAQLTGAENLFLNAPELAAGGGQADTYATVADLLASIATEAQNAGTGQKSLCENITEGLFDPEILVAPILEAEDLDELNEVYADETAVAIHVSLMQTWFEDDGYENAKQNAVAVLDVLKAFENNYEALLDDAGEPDTATIKEVIAVTKTCDDNSNKDKSECVKEKHEEIVIAKSAADDSNKSDKNDSTEPQVEKVLICHIPPGNPENAHEIEVGSPSVPFHLEHGDNVGPCAPAPVVEEPVVELPPVTEPEPAPSDDADDEDSESTDNAVSEAPAVTEPEVVETAPVATEEPEVEEPAEDPAPAEPEEIAAPEPEVTPEEPEVCAASELDPSASLATAWTYAFGHIYGGFYRMIPGPSAAIGEVRPDIDGLEVATGNEEYYPLGYYGTNVPLGRWFLFRNNGAVEFWKNTENDEAHSSVNLYDLDDDGKLELLGGTTSGNQVQAITGNGTWFWRYILNGHSISTPTVAKLTPDGDPIVFNGSMDNQVRAINGKTGLLVWSFNTGRWIWSTPAVADLDNDGHKEVVIASDGQYYGNGVLYSLDAETGTVNWQVNLGQKVRSSAALADLDGDGTLEVLIGDSTGIFKAFAGDTGAIQWSYNAGGEILSSAAVGDIDGDGDFEIVFGSANKKVHALNADGSVFWTRTFNGAVHGSPALVRRNACDTILHVYLTTMAGEIAVLNGVDGAVKALMNIGYEVASSPTVGDTDGDGKLEIFFQDRRADLQGMVGDVFWSVRDDGSSVEPFAREWPLFRGTPEHTGVYPHGEE